MYQTFERKPQNIIPLHYRNWMLLSLPPQDTSCNKQLTVNTIRWLLTAKKKNRNMYATISVASLNDQTNFRSLVGFT
jgi:hypothetical protein